MKAALLLLALTLSTGCAVVPVSTSSGYSPAEYAVDAEQGPDAYVTDDAYGPPPISFQVPPDVIVMPDTNDVYVVPDIAVDLFFWNGWWWRPWDGRWYRSQYYDRGWAYYNSVPGFYFDIDPGWRDHYRSRNWYGYRWNYEPVSHRQLQQNWRSWQNNRHWERQRTWGVQGYQPRPQHQRQELRQLRQQQYQQRPDFHHSPQQIRPTPQPQVRQSTPQQQDKTKIPQMKEQNLPGTREPGRPRTQQPPRFQQPGQQPQPRQPGPQTQGKLPLPPSPNVPRLQKPPQPHQQEEPLVGGRQGGTLSAERSQYPRQEYPGHLWQQGQGGRVSPRREAQPFHTPASPRPVQAQQFQPQQPGQQLQTQPPRRQTQEWDRNLQKQKQGPIGQSLNGRGTRQPPQARQPLIGNPGTRGTGQKVQGR